MTPRAVLPIMLLAAACAAGAERRTSSACSGGFPKGAFATSPEADKMMADRFWAALIAAGERPLCEKPQVNARRLVVLPSFGPPRVLRIEEADSQKMHLVWAQLTGRGGYELGELAARKEREASGKEAEGLQVELAKLERLMATAGGVHDGGTDGTLWLVEGWRAQQHTVAATWSPRGEVEETLGRLLSSMGDGCADCR